MTDWITDGVPNFCVHGFHTGRKVKFKLSDGREIVDIYQGYGIFGTGDGYNWMDLPQPVGVIGWKPMGEDDDQHQ